MSDEVNYKNNPLHGLGLKALLEEIVECYGFEVLYAYVELNCFKTNPSIASSVKFLKKTDWAREKVEGFYLYQYKNLPRPSSEQFSIPPRDRIIPDGHVPGEPARLSIEDAERLREKRAKKASEFGKGAPRRGRSDSPYGGSRSSNSAHSSNNAYDNKGSDDSGETGDSSADPWGAWKSKQ